MNRKNEMNCQQLRDWIDEAEGQEPAAEMRQHLDGCADCRAFVADARFAQQLFAQAPRVACPDRVAIRIMNEVDREIAEATPVLDGTHDFDSASLLQRLRGLFAVPQLARLALPLAAAAVLLAAILGPREHLPSVDPTDSRVDIAQPPEKAQEICELDLDEIYRSLGLDRAQMDLDERTVCLAAEEVKMAMAVVGRAMNQTAHVIGDQTRGRVTKSVRKGLERGIGLDPMDDSRPQQGG